MKTMTREEVIATVESARKAGVVVDLTKANLSGVDLSGVDLPDVNLTKANLRRANLTRANLYDAILSDANLTGACLYSAYLRGADLSRADLSGVNLTKAYLYGANLTDAILSGATLTGAYLRGSNLSGVTGIICMNIADPRGYRPVAVWREDHWMVAAGCHWFTVDDALKHWGPGYTGDREIGDLYLEGIEPLAYCEGL